MAREFGDFEAFFRFCLLWVKLALCEIFLQRALFSLFLSLSQRPAWTFLTRLIQPLTMFFFAFPIFWRGPKCHLFAMLLFVLLSFPSILRLSSPFLSSPSLSCSSLSFLFFLSAPVNPQSSSLLCIPVAVFFSQLLIAQNLAWLQRKIRLCSLMELASSKPSASHIIAFSEIATVCQVPVNEVRFFCLYPLILSVSCLFVFRYFFFFCFVFLFTLLFFAAVVRLNCYCWKAWHWNLLVASSIKSIKLWIFNGLFLMSWIWIKLPRFVTEYNSGRSMYMRLAFN